MPLFANSEKDGSAVCPAPLKDLDWKKLRRQKKWLLLRYEQAFAGKDALAKGSTMGLLNLVDAIQEFAVEVVGIDPAIVWGPDVIEDPMREALDAEREMAA